MSSRRSAGSGKDATSNKPGKRRASPDLSGALGRRRSPPSDLSVTSVSPVRGRKSTNLTDINAQSPENALGTSLGPSQPLRGVQQQSGKVAIPRIPRVVDTAVASPAEKSRVSHACEPCRQRKTKCSGERPVCKHCENFQITCVYADGKRDRTKKELVDMATRIRDYEKLLRDISRRMGPADQGMIRRALQKEDSNDDDNLHSDTSSRRTQEDFVDGAIEIAGEHRVSACVGSTGALDNIDEDYNRDPSARATGFMGKNSEVMWMQRLNIWADGVSSEDDSRKSHRQTTQTTFEHRTRPLTAEALSTNASTYHCDDLPIVVADQVDPFELPPKHVADRFFQSYLETVHTAFPILGKSTYINQYQTFANREQVNTGNNWRAILNMIFAIAAKYSHLIQADWRGDERDHLIYFTRARILGFNGESVFDHPELQQIQVAGLMAFYLTAINQVNRAWAISGIGIRSAVTLGMNLLNDSSDVHKGSREIRYRVWWALCSTERMLAVMTGRPTSISDSDCSVPLPLPINEDILFDERETMTQPASRSGRRRSSTASPKDFNFVQSKSTRDGPPDGTSSSDRFSEPDQGSATTPSDASCFLFTTKLGVLTNEIMERLYRAGASKETWAQAQNKITGLNSKIDDWFRSLPVVFDFTRKQRDQQFLRHRFCLGFAYYSARLIVNRPGLCRTERKIASESGKAKEFSRVIAAKCVHSAKAMMGMLPDEPNAIGLYGIAPWWCLVHHLVQASTILMLELSFRADHMPDEAKDILGAAKKAVIWLRSLSDENMAARRAWVMCDAMLRKVIGRDVDDVPMALSLSHAYGSQSLRPSSRMETTFPRMDPPVADEPFYSGGPVDDFRPHLYDSYDEFISSGMPAPAPAVAPFGVVYPTAAQLRAVATSDTQNAPEYLSESQHRWEEQ